MAIWNSKTFWQRVEWGAALATALSVVFTLVLEWKIVGAVVTVVGAGCVFLARWRLAALEEQARRRQEDLTRLVVLRILEVLREQYFAKARATEWHLHRVTLFVCRPGKTVGEPKRLEIYARAGLFPQSTTSWVVDENRQEVCEGIPGQIWFLETSLTSEALPPWPADPHDQAGQEAYARAANFSLEKARSLNIRPRRFTGVRVMVRGEKWGLLLLDSREPGLIGQRKENVLTRFRDLLERVLEECLP